MNDDSIEGALFGFFIEYLSGSSIYAAGYELSNNVFIFLMPVLLALAVLLRVNSELVNGLSNESNWAKASKSLVMIMIFLAPYYGFMTLLILFFNGLDSWFGSAGSIKSIFSGMSTLVTSITQDADFSIGNIPKTVAWVFFFFTFLLVMFVVSFLNIAHAVLFSVAFFWGMVALPMAVSQEIKLVKGWLILLAVALVWPIIASVLFYLESGMIHGAIEAVINFTDDKNVQAAQIYMVWAVLNLIIAATAVSAPMLTHSLVSNSGAIGGVIAPYVAAAGIAAAGVAKAADKTASPVKGAFNSLGGKGKELAGVAGSAALGAASSGAMKGFNKITGSQPQPTVDTGASGETQTPTDTTGESAPASTDHASPTANTQPQQSTTATETRPAASVPTASTVQEHVTQTSSSTTDAAKSVSSGETPKPTADNERAAHSVTSQAVGEGVNSNTASVSQNQSQQAVHSQDSAKHTVPTATVEGNKNKEDNTDTPLDNVDQSQEIPKPTVSENSDSAAVVPVGHAKASDTVAKRTKNATKKTPKKNYKKIQKILNAQAARAEGGAGGQGGPPQSTSTPPEKQKKKKQTKRGAIISQNKKPNKPKT